MLGGETIHVFSACTEIKVATWLYSLKTVDDLARVPAKHLYSKFNESHKEIESKFL